MSFAGHEGRFIVIAQLCYATTIFRKMRFTYRSPSSTNGGLNTMS